MKIYNMFWYIIFTYRRTVSPKKYLDADSPEELLKSQKRDIEFYSRFARNYAYDFQRQVQFISFILELFQTS